ncbi:hypothetical protein WDW86_16725 [Bdellovibrionota bacterium FG-2]
MPAPDGDFKNCILEARQEIRKFAEQESLAISFCGVLVTARWPFSLQTPNEEIAEFLCRKLLGGKRFAEAVASFSFQIGKKVGEFFVNYQARSFEVRAVAVDSSTLMERGVEILFDVNNRPKINKGNVGDELCALESAARRELNALVPSL